MAKLKLLNTVARAAQGATMIVNDTDTDMPLLAADGTPTTLTLLGADSPTAQRLSYAKKATAQSKAYVAWNTGKGKADLVTPEEIAQQEADSIDYLVALTVSWHGFEDDDDQPVPFSPAVVKQLYESNPMIREQALAFVSDRAAFFAHS